MKLLIQLQQGRTSSTFREHTDDSERSDSDESELAAGDLLKLMSGFDTPLAQFRDPSAPLLLSLHTSKTSRELSRSKELSSCLFLQTETESLLSFTDQGCDGGRPP
jgi:hypothetical protein